MTFAGINYLAIIVAAIVGFAIGAAWYTALSKRWMKEARIEPRSGQPMAVLFATSFVALLVMAWVLAGTIGHLGLGQVTVTNGAISGLFLWLGFIATTLAVNQRYQGYGWNLTLIDAGHWLLVAIAMGAVIGAFGV